MPVMLRWYMMMEIGEEKADLMKMSSNPSRDASFTLITSVVGSFHCL